MKKILKVLSFIFYYNIVPKKIFLKIQFKRKHGYRLNLKNPLTLNEKIQWLKLYDKKSLNKICADKFLVKDFVAKNISQDIVIQSLGFFNNYKKINLKDIPNQPFVVKSTNGCGQVLIVREPQKLDLGMLKKTIKKWSRLINRIYPYGKEWQYRWSKTNIIFEELLLDCNRLPNDLKFHCFNGKVEFIYVSVDREGINKRSIYNSNWEPLNFSWTNDPNKKERAPDLEKPQLLNEMISVSEKIAKYFKYVRVDLYNISGRIYLGEITLHHASGFDRIEPIDFDLYLGQKLDLKIEPEISWN